MDRGEKSNSKIGWTEEEQNYLELLCKSQKLADWKYISTEMNTAFPQKNRTAKQCRQRFHNYIRFSGPQVKKETWSSDEDQKLFHMYTNVGSKWAEISKSMPGRSQNNIKNRFYGKLRKFLRIINDALKRASIKNRKPIKQATITKILSRENFSKENIKNSQKIEEEDSQCFLDKLKLDILSKVLWSSEQICEDDLTSLLSRIHQFNLQAKAENIRENRLGKKIKRKRLPPLRKDYKGQIMIQNKENNLEQEGQTVFEERVIIEDKNQASELNEESSFSQIELSDDFRAQISLPRNFEEQISFIFCKKKANAENFGSFQF